MKKDTVLIKQNNINYHINNYEKYGNNHYKKKFRFYIFIIIIKKGKNYKCFFFTTNLSILLLFSKKKILVNKGVDIYEKFKRYYSSSLKLSCGSTTVSSSLHNSLGSVVNTTLGGSSNS